MKGKERRPQPATDSRAAPEQNKTCALGLVGKPEHVSSAEEPTSAGPFFSQVWQRDRLTPEGAVIPGRATLLPAGLGTGCVFGDRGLRKRRSFQGHRPGRTGISVQILLSTAPTFCSSFLSPGRPALARSPLRWSGLRSN